MTKKIQAYVKLQVPAGKANPSPPIGPALGQQGVNIMEFCKQFNARTQKMEAGMPIPVVITVFQDRSFTFITKTPPNTYFLKKAAGIEAGAKTVGTQIVGKVTKKQIEEIAKQKLPDLNYEVIEPFAADFVKSANKFKNIPVAKQPKELKSEKADDIRKGVLAYMRERSGEL